MEEREELMEEVNEDPIIEEDIDEGMLRAKTFEIRDDMPEEIKKQIQQLNAMSNLINSGFDENSDEEDEEDEEDEIDESDDADYLDADDSDAETDIKEDENVTFSDIF